jgi:hypothetical protein
MKRPLALVVVLLGLLCLVVAGWWFASIPGRAPASSVSEIETIGAGSDGVRREVFHVQPSSTTVQVAPDDAFELAYQALARATEGYAVACLVPDHLPVPLSAGPLRTHGRWLRGTVGVPEGVLSLRPPLDDCPDDPDARDACLARGMAELRLAPRATVRWWGGQGHAANCSVDTPDLLPFDGVALLADGSAPEELLAFGCEGLDTSPGGRFNGSVSRGGACTLFFQSGNADATLTLQSHEPLSGLRVTLVARDASGGLAAMPDLMDELELGLIDAMDAQPLEVALTDPSLTPEARAIVQGWLDEERVQHREQAEMLEKTRETLAEIEAMKADLRERGIEVPGL